MKPVKNKRIYEIDLLRFVAAIFVVCYHFFFHGIVTQKLADEFYSNASDFFKYGFLGVDIFFILSGLVILVSAKNRSIQDFVKARFLRLYPVYWVCMIITAAVLLCAQVLDNLSIVGFIANLTMYQTILGYPSIDGVYWTLLIELFFYMWVAVMIYFNLLKYTSIIFFSWVLLAALFLLIGLESKYITKILLFNWISYFSLGVFLYLNFLEKERTLCSMLGLILSFVLSIFKTIDRTEALSASTAGYLEPFISAGIIILTLMLLIYFILKKSVKNIKVIKLFSILGAASYPLYLIHQEIGFVIINKLTENGWNFFFVSISMIVLFIFLSIFLSKYIEPFLTSRIKKFL